MATVYTVKFFGGRLDTSGITNLYQVPTGKLAVVRDVTAYKRAGLAATAWAFGHRATAAGNFTGLWGGVAAVLADDPRSDVRQVFYAGEYMVGQVGAATTYAMWVSGYLFDSP